MATGLSIVIHQERFGPGAKALIISIGGGAALGIASLLATMHPLVLAELRTALALSIPAAIIGALVGISTSPFVYGLLRRKHLSHAVPIVYVPTLFCVVVLSRGSILLAAYGGAGALVLACIAARYLLPNVLSPYSQVQCRRCGYDLRGHSLGSSCPECGTGAVDDETYRKLILSESATWRWTATTLTVVTALFLAVSIVLWLPYKRVDVSRFKEVEPGMSPREVQSLLGKPHRVVVDSAGGENWCYGRGPFDYMWSEEWRVRFRSGEVAETEVISDWWP